MLKIVLSLRKALKAGKFILLCFDTLQYFLDQAEIRGLSGVVEKKIINEL